MGRQLGTWVCHPCPSALASFLCPELKLGAAPLQGGHLQCGKPGALPRLPNSYAEFFFTWRGSGEPLWAPELWQRPWRGWPPACFLLQALTPSVACPQPLTFSEVPPASSSIPSTPSPTKHLLSLTPRCRIGPGPVIYSDLGLAMWGLGEALGVLSLIFLEGQVSKDPEQKQSHRWRFSATWDNPWRTSSVGARCEQPPRGPAHCSRG